MADPSLTAENRPRPHVSAASHECHLCVDCCPFTQVMETKSREGMVQPGEELSRATEPQHVNLSACFSASPAMPH